MNRRAFLQSACLSTVGLVGTATPTTSSSITKPTSPGVVWRRSYNESLITSVVSAHGGGHALVGRGGAESSSGMPVRVTITNESGTVRKRRQIRPDTSKETRESTADIIQTESGYAVATGSWFAKLNADLSVETTGFASEYETNSTTHLVETSNGIAVAAESDAPNHASTRVLGFDDDGELQWTRKYGEEDSKWLEFLLDAPDGGLVVGGRSGDPWLASLTADGSESWETTVTNAPTGVGTDATRDGDGFTLFGSSNMVRLDASRLIDWRRSFTSFRDAFSGKITRTTDGGYVVAAGVARDRIRIGKTNSKGRLSWSYEYTLADDGGVFLNDIAERAPGEYLAVGSRRDAQEGWALLLAETKTPTTSPVRQTATSTQTNKVTTTTVTKSATSEVPNSTTEGESTAIVPGFGIRAALVGTAAGLLARRCDTSP